MGVQKPQEELIIAILYVTAINNFKTIARKRRTLSKGKILIISRYEKKCFKQEQEGKKVTEIPKERIQELLNFKKEYEDEPETEKCLEELLAYKETMAGIARMLGVTQYDITNKNEELLEVNLNNDVIKNALDRYRSFENTFLNKVTVMALKELLEYRETELAPDQVNEMKSKFEHYKDAYCDIQERYNRLLNYEMEE
jgi:hypothetical protein